MQTYILMTKLSSESGGQIKDRTRLGHEWMDQVKEKCPGVKFLSHYAVLGRFDFLSIYEANNSEEAAKVSMISLANGAFLAESCTVIEYKRFLELTEQL